MSVGQFIEDANMRGTQMKPDQAIRMATAMLRNHALGDWTATVENILAWPALGARCSWDTRRIVLDYDTLRFSRYKIRWILLHEIAHALAGESAGHGPRWQRKARSLGVPIFDIEEHASRDRQEQAARALQRLAHYGRT